jgi:hypothetical protein
MQPVDATLLPDAVTPGNELEPANTGIDRAAPPFSRYGAPRSVFRLWIAA